MLVVRVELWSAVTGQKTEIARAIIHNVGGTVTRGDYEVITYRGRSAKDFNKRVVQRKAEVRDHPRLRDHVWTLVAKALNAAGYLKESSQDEDLIS